MYESLPNAKYVLTRTGLAKEVQYREQEIFNQDSRSAGSRIASLSMGIQKGKYDGTEEAFKKWT